MGQIGVVSGQDGFSRSSTWSSQRKQKAAFFACPPEPVVADRDASAFLANVLSFPALHDTHEKRL
ncbi:hypothetical protein [Alteribacillus iranensis]|uniref:hypothetical protein n=1 Tax=Alteribacillus iranensis TaxID=930128 RepID=UPI000B8890C6|nr:hypothetical protein [Alteribacillus iranensis]